MFVIIYMDLVYIVIILYVTLMRQYKKTDPILGSVFWIVQQNPILYFTKWDLKWFSLLCFYQRTIHQLNLIDQVGLVPKQK